MCLLQKFEMFLQVFMSATPLLQTQVRFPGSATNILFWHSLFPFLAPSLIQGDKKETQIKI